MRYTIRRACGAAFVLLCLLVPGALDASAQQASKRARHPNAPSKPSTRAKARDSAGAKTSIDINARATERQIDESIPVDPAVEAMLAPYREGVRELETVIGRLEGDLVKGRMGGGSLGNFVADAIRSRAQARLGREIPIGIVNKGGLRKNVIKEGDIRVMDIYELLPFENSLVVIDLTGAQLMRLLSFMAAQGEAAQSGLLVRYRTGAAQKTELVSITQNAPEGEREIDPALTYTIVTIDYLLKRGGEYAVLQEATNVRPLNITMRDAVIEFVKMKTAAEQTIRATLDRRYASEDEPERTEVEEPR